MCMEGEPFQDDNEGGFKKVRTVAETFLAVAAAVKAWLCMDERQSAEAKSLSTWFVH